MLRIAAVFGLLGLAAATALVAWSGYADVLSALERAGWGIVWTSLYHLIPMAVCVVGWRALMPGKRRPGFWFFLYLLWVRASINNLMPVARIGGEIVSVRIMVKRGIRKAPAIASTVVETTLSVIGVFLFTLLGVGLFAARISDGDMTTRLMLATLASVPLIGALLLLQRAGFFAIATRIVAMLFRDKWKNFSGNAARLDRAVRAMYRRSDRALFCGFMQFASWALGSVEIWLALYFIGHPLPMLECVMIEAIIQATASAAFIVPAALGVQEAGFLLLGHLLGLPTEAAAALAVIRRCRDLLLYVPGLLAWQAQEGHWLWRSGRRKKG